MFKRLCMVTGVIIAAFTMVVKPTFAEEGPGAITVKEVVPVTEVSEAQSTTVYEEEFEGIAGGFTQSEQSKGMVTGTTKITSSYTQDDLEVLAHVLCGEAHTYSDEEQRYVGSVVLNRVKHPAYPNTIRGVVFQRGQYACTWDGNYYRQPTEANYKNAQWLLEHGSILPDNVVYQSKARQGSGLYLRTQYHQYCYY